jgi:hypothetical protein
VPDISKAYSSNAEHSSTARQEGRNGKSQLVHETNDRLRATKIKLHPLNYCLSNFTNFYFERDTKLRKQTSPKNSKYTSVGK